MAKSKRMFNSNLVNASSFKMKFSNKAKLLYFYIMLNADDRGFCDNADEIIVLLDSNDLAFHGDESLDLAEHGYSQALSELIDKHMLLMFENKYGDKVYLVRQWYLHNQIPKDRVTETTYIKYLEQVTVNKENEYEYKQSTNADVNSSQKAQKQETDGESEQQRISGNDSEESLKAIDIAIRIKKGEPVSNEERKFLETYEAEKGHSHGVIRKGGIQGQDEDGGIFA